MDYFFQLDIAAIALSIILFVVLLLRKSYPTLSRRLFKILILFNFLSSVFDILVTFLCDQNSSLPVWFKYGLTMIYFAVHLSLHFIFILYVIAKCKGDMNNKVGNIVIFIIYTLTLGFLFTTPIHKLTFTFELNSSTGLYDYTMHLGLAAFEVIGALSIIYAFALTILNRKKLSSVNLALDLFFLITWLAAIIVETFNETLFVENFTIVVTVSMITIIADNPSDYFVKGTYVYNESTFTMVYGEKFQRNIPFKLAVFNYKDFDLYIQKVGQKRANVAITETLNHCRKQFGQSSVYALGRNVIVIDLKGISDVEKTLEGVAANCYKGGLERNPELKLRAQFVVFDCPNDVDNLNDLHTGIYMTLFNSEVIGDKLINNFDKTLLEERHRKERIIMKLHDAIENDGFDIYYQPIFNWKKNKFEALEALIRFKNNGEEFFSPGEFIPIAEEEGLIFDIDEIVFEKVCRFIRNNDIAKYGVNFVDVNLSLLKLIDPSTVDRYVELISRYEVKPSFINLEITETAEGDEQYLSVVRQNISRFREKGFSFSLDDYGSGYSTVIYMAEMDTKIVKIDASILWNAMKNKKYFTVLENCVRLIYCFDKDCVCEGVETEKMAEILMKLGVQYFQGFYYSKPLPETEILKFLAEKNK